MPSIYLMFKCSPVVILILVASIASAQEVGISRPQQATYDSAAVVVNGKVLFNVIGISSSPAKKRAKRIASRIEALAQDPTFDPESIAIRVEDDRTLLVAGDQRIMTIRDLDAAGEGVKPKTLAEIYLKKIKRVIIAYRHDREPEIVTKNLVFTAIATVILIALTIGVLISFRWVTNYLESHFKKHVENLEAQSKRLVQAEQIWNLISGALKLSKALFIVLLIYIYLNSVLSLFPWTRFFAQSLIEYTINPLLIMSKAFVDYLPKLFFLVMLILVVQYLLKLNRMFFAAVARSRIRFANFDAEWAWPTYRIVRLLMFIFAAVIAYPYIPGSDSAAFKGLSLLFGVLISLGSTSMLSNIIAGYAMIYRRAFKVGDRIKIGDIVGDVEEMRLLVTHLRSPKNESVVIPNSHILNNAVTNYTTMALEEGLILHTIVGIGYEVPWRQVKALLLMAAERTSGLRTDKTPYVLQKSLGEFSVDYELNVYCDQASNMMSIYSELHSNIQDVFNEYDVQIMTPAYEADTTEPKIVPKAKWFTAPAQVPNESSAQDAPK